MSEHFYTGIGARKVPKNIYILMIDIARYLEENNYILRSGGAEGCDEAFETGVKSFLKKDIFLPYRDFNKNKSNLILDESNCLNSKKAWDLAKKFHPRFNKLADKGKKYMARNSFQVLGEDVDTEDKSDFLICWTAEARYVGGTSQAMRIADYYRIPIYNLANDHDRKNIFSLLDNHIRFL